MIVGVSPSLLEVKVFLGGPFDSGSGLMNDALRGLTSFPIIEPYTALGFDMANGGGQQLISGVLSTTGNNAIVDWVLVELRDPNNISNIVAVRVGLLQRDGDVVDVNGFSPLQFDLVGNYRIAVRHRNHLGCMTSSNVNLGGATDIVDFTIAGTGTYGTDAQQTIGSVRALWPGDTYRDGVVKYMNTNNDADVILEIVGETTPTNVISNVYSHADVNMDSDIKYTGAGNDRDIILITIGGVDPEATRTEQLP
jgi:hypothetical protein